MLLANGKTPFLLDQVFLNFICLPFGFSLDILLQNFEKDNEKLDAVNEHYNFLINASFPFGKLFDFRECISSALRINFLCLDGQVI